MALLVHKTREKLMDGEGYVDDQRDAARVVDET